MDNNNFYQGQNAPPQGYPPGQNMAPPGNPQGYPPGQNMPPQGNPGGYQQGQNQGFPPQYNAHNMNQYSAVPQEIKKWNWGPFMFGIIWGIGNKAYITLIAIAFYIIQFFPIIGLIGSIGAFVWAIICGIKGNEWAWKTGDFKDVEQFMAVQRTWNRAGFVYFIIMIAIIVFMIILVIVMGAAFYNEFTDLYNSIY